jgi:ferredoxin
VPGSVPASDERVIDLARACPGGALVVTDAESGAEIDVG